MKKKVLFLMLSLVLIILSLNTTSVAKTIQLRYASIVPPMHVGHRLLEEWIAEVEKKTHGKVRIKLFPGQSLLKSAEMYDGIRTGVADIGWLMPFINRGRFPLIRGMELPLGLPSSEVTNQIGWEMIKEFKPKEFSEVKVLYFNSPPPRQLHTKKKAVRVLEDYRGMECAAPGVEKIAKLLGAVPVSAPVMENYDMLAKGIIDGALVSADTLKGFRLYEVTNYTTIININQTSFVQIMNLKTWNSLPPEVQKAIDEVSDGWVAYCGTEWDKGAKASLEFSKSKGQEIITLPPKELTRWYQTVQPLLDEYVAETKGKGLPGQAFLDEIGRLKKKYMQ